MMRESNRPAIHFSASDFHRAMLAWYDRAGRDLPWRAKGRRKPDPYRVWLSEVMLQQTTVRAVIPYFEAFLLRWPTVTALASASPDEILAAWAGLGYYSRARKLHDCARILAIEGFPQTEKALRALPGVGAYTAAAIAAIAFDEPAAVVDGNVERVLARIFALAAPLPSVKPEIRALAAELTPTERPGDYAQAIMDLGATICGLRAASCLKCPAAPYCLARAEGKPERYPKRESKPERPLRTGDAFVIVRELNLDPHILLKRRPEKGLLGGMMEVPSTTWDVIDCSHAKASDEAPSLPANRSSAWHRCGMVRHTFTHFRLELRVFASSDASIVNAASAIGGEWARVADLSQFALPTVMKKVVAAGLSALTAAIDPPKVRR